MVLTSIPSFVSLPIYREHPLCIPDCGGATATTLPRALKLSVKVICLPITPLPLKPRSHCHFLLPRSRCYPQSRTGSAAAVVVSEDDVGVEEGDGGVHSSTLRWRWDGGLRGILWGHLLETRAYSSNARQREQTTRQKDVHQPPAPGSRFAHQRRLEVVLFKSDAISTICRRIIISSLCRSPPLSLPRVVPASVSSLLPPRVASCPPPPTPRASTVPSAN